MHQFKQLNIGKYPAYVGSKKYIFRLPKIIASNCFLFEILLWKRLFFWYQWKIWSFRCPLS